LKITRLQSNPRFSDPYPADNEAWRTPLGPNVVVLHAVATNLLQSYIVVLDKVTGEKVKIEFVPDNT
jgi:hypothetical protein